MSAGLDPETAVVGVHWLVQSTLTLLLLIGSGVFVALLLLLIVGDASERRRQGNLRRRLQASGLPTALTLLSGKVLWTSPAMQGSTAGRTGTIVDLLAPWLMVDPALVYRLSRAAIEVGFAFEVARARDNGAIHYLSVQAQDGDRLVWSVLLPEKLVGAVPAVISDPYELASFAQLRQRPGGAVSVNPRFRALFGADPSAVLARLGDERMASEGSRVLLPQIDGAARIVRVFRLDVPEADGGQDWLFFPVSTQGAEDSGGDFGLEVVPVALLQLDLNGRVLWSNAAARGILGRDVPLGAPLGSLVDPLGRSLQPMIDEAASGAARGRGEMVRMTGAGFETFLQISLTRVELDGAATLLAVLSDANELRQLEDKFAQSQKMEAVGKLAGGVAHDFNNVLTAISGHCDLLLLGKDASHPDYSDLVQIRNNSNRAAALVRQLLAFSRKQTLNPELLSLQDVVSDTLYLLDRLIGEKVQLSLDHGRDLGAVRADQQQLEQALMNLVVNARDAMPRGGTVTISTRNRIYATEERRDGTTVPPGKYVEISVADQGTGISPHVIDKVFDPFFTTKPLGEGTGLGLSTVYGIVKQSGGYIFVENLPEGGACFRILLPAVNPDDEPAAPPPVVTERPDLTGNGAVLLVEDEAPVRSFAVRALRLRGYEVTAAASAEEAMEYLSVPTNLVDLIVSDVVMPGMDGPTFAAKARELRPGLRVVFVSGYAEESFRKNLTDTDFLFLAKPFSLSDLTAKVKEALGQDA